MRSKIEPMKKAARTLGRHLLLLLNWFRTKKTVGQWYWGGFNTKTKLTTRKAFGFRNYRASEATLYHALGALPLPEITHEFF